MCHKDPGGRFQMSRYYIGNSKNENFLWKAQAGMILEATVTLCRALNMREGGLPLGGSPIFTANI